MAAARDCARPATTRTRPCREDGHDLLPLAVFATGSEERNGYRLPFVTYTNSLDPVTTTRWISPQVENVTGYPAEQIVDRPGFFEQVVIHPEDRQAVGRLMRISRQELLPFSRDYRILTRDGVTRWVHDESVPVCDRSGSPELVQGYFHDVTERKRLEASLMHAQKAEALGLAAAGIAHDFNNVLTAVAGYVALTERMLPDAHPARAPLAGLRSATELGAGLSTRLLTFSRRQDPCLGRIDLTSLVSDLYELLHHVVGDGTQIELKIASEVPVLADLGQIEHVLVNLVTNARDAMPNGGTIRVGAKRVTLERGEPTARLGVAPGLYGVLVVADEGIGIDEETRERIFDPFFTTKPRGAGTGLGLSTAQRVVRDSGGAIDVTSIVGRGTTFRVLLPSADGWQRDCA